MQYMSCVQNNQHGQITPWAGMSNNGYIIIVKNMALKATSRCYQTDQHGTMFPIIQRTVQHKWPTSRLLEKGNINGVSAPSFGSAQT